MLLAIVLMLVGNIDFVFKVMQTAFAFEQAINAVFIAQTIVMLLKEKCFLLHR